MTYISTSENRRSEHSKSITTMLTLLLSIALCLSQNCCSWHRSGLESAEGWNDLSLEQQQALQIIAAIEQGKPIPEFK